MTRLESLENYLFCMRLTESLYTREISAGGFGAQMLVLSIFTLKQEFEEAEQFRSTFSLFFKNTLNFMLLMHSFELRI